MESLSEFEMIARLFAPLAGEGAFELRDDAAILTPNPGRDLVLTKDMLIEGVHFFADDPPASLAHKALAVNMSDLAAKGARPRAFLLGLGRAERLDAEWLTAFAQGLAAASGRFGCRLLGGDTVKASQLILSVTAFGEVPSGRMVRRETGKAGDALFVTGSIGDAALGLKLRLAPEAGWARRLGVEHRASLLDRYLHPQPRLGLAPALIEHARAAMDVSDGLVGDAAKLAPHLGRIVDIPAIPFSPAAQAAFALAPELVDAALTGGDDYEILCAVPPESEERFAVHALQLGVPVTDIFETLQIYLGSLYANDFNQFGRT
ncbi:MAG TPA: thiamine-phosphate kinase, partial [Rhabdaerophilum sp.]|nr:thiamine-phosphate kinase [Rhabdaerophilum sp.]